ncbi:hypothetical protein HYW59_03780 [Candidatus Kaiserbacteria bacterium]|nr:hypothetical protein [Candidatus Kaiserbacteria bacterium]
MKGFASWAHNASWFTLGIVFASILLFGVVAVQAATTISTNISTGGTLGVTGLSTLTAGYVSAASSTVTGGAFTVTDNTSLQRASTTQITATGNVWFNGFATTTASNGNFATQGTLSITGLSTLVAGFVSQASSTVAGAFTTNGANQFDSTVNASSTLQVTGATRIYGDVTLDGGSGALTLTTSNTATSTLSVGCIQMNATSTASPGKLTLVSNLGTASTTGANGLYFVPVWTFGTCP